MKLKKQIWYMLLLFIAPLNAQISAENTTTLFRLERVGLGKVIVANPQYGGPPLAKNVSSEAFNATDGYLQALIIQPVNNRLGEVYIASASRHGTFLSYNNETNKIEFSRSHSNYEDPPGFCWNLEIADTKNQITGPVELDTFIIRAVGDPLHRVLRLDDQGNFKLEGLKNTLGADMTPANDEEQPHQEFRFVLKKVNNVF